MSAKLKLGILISGRGSNLQSLIDAALDSDFPAEIVTVISNVPDAGGLKRAQQANIPTTVINHKYFDGREPFQDALQDALACASVELICLAGFMRLLTDSFVNRWLDKLINIHPSLLPSFKGLHTHERAIKAGVRFSGCTVHFVRPEMDDGPIIVQSALPIRQDDTPDTLAGRVLIEEHKIYPLAVRMIAEDRVSVENGVVKIKDALTPDSAIINPG
jgi:phosphoribosylglycinamide formyltransferase-1